MRAHGKAMNTFILRMLPIIQLSAVVRVARAVERGGSTFMGKMVK